MKSNPMADPAPAVVEVQVVEEPIVQGTYVSYSTNPAPSAPPYATTPPDYSAKLLQFRNRYEINPKYAAMLDKIVNYSSVIICDDSGSMNEIADPDTASRLTRWEELIQAVEIIVEAHAVFDIACDIYFINRGYVRNVRTFSQVQPYLIEKPHGGTNLLNVLNIVRQNHVGVDMGKPLILHIFTDGHPTNAYGQEDIQSVANWFRNRPLPAKFPVSIVLCTDDEEIERSYRSMEYNPRTISNQGILGVDVTEDYRGEARDVWRTRGRSYRFSFGDYIVKILVGSIDRRVHDIDLPDGLNSCCVIC